MTDYFNILGVNAGASDDEIKKAYKKLAMTHHPDRGGDQGKFQQIQEAYSILSDPNKRAQWEHERQYGGAGGGFAGGGFPGGFHFNFGGGDINDILRQFHGGGPFARQQQPAKNRDLRVGIELELASTLETQKHHINVQNLNGGVKTVEIEIPRGVQSGMQIRYTGHGDNSIGNLPPGDLYIDFRVRGHPDFQVNGLDLIKSVKINCIDAIIGYKASVYGLDGTQFEINIPSGTQQNAKFRIPSQGLWDVNQPIRGDLLLEIGLIVPSNVTASQLENLEKIKL